MKQGAAKETAHAYFPSFLRSRARSILLDKWQNNRQYDIEEEETTSRFNGQVYRPQGGTDAVTDEYTQLESLAASGFAGLVVTTLAQTAYVQGIKRPGDSDNDASWQTWQANRWDSVQTSVHRCAIGQGVAYGVAIPGKDPLTGNPMTRYLARSPMKMAAFYDADDDEWPMFAIEAEPQQFTGLLDGNGEAATKGWMVRLYDEDVIHRLSCEGNGTEIDSWTYIDHVEHGLPVPPVARLANRMDLEGRAVGEIEPVLPLLRRIDQDVFDRLIVQRFGAWKVRYIAGMAKPKDATEERAQAIRLRVQDLLISGNENTKFGTLDATDPAGFSGVTDADLRMLSAVTQTPPHHLLGLSSNLQAEALAAAESGLQRKSHDFRINAGEFHEQMSRMDAMYRGDFAAAAATDRQVRWLDTQSRAFVQTVQALGMAATQLKMPVEMLWERFPDWTDSDTTRAKELVENGSIEALLAEFMGTEQTGAPGAPVQ
jgi:hypothetical protein